jgi:hypothetical protein
MGCGVKYSRHVGEGWRLVVYLNILGPMTQAGCSSKGYSYYY